MQNFEELFNQNNSSPTYVFVAHKKIENNEIDAAIKLLLEGLQKYPYHPSALLLLAKAYALAGDFSKSIDNLNKANKIINNNYTYNYYNEQIEKIKFKLNYTEPIANLQNTNNLTNVYTQKEKTENNLSDTFNDLTTNDTQNIQNIDINSLQDNITNNTQQDLTDINIHDTLQLDPIDPKLNDDINIDTITSDLTDLPDLPEDLKDLFK